MEWYFRNDQPIYTQLTRQITLAAEISRKILDGREVVL